MFETESVGPFLVQKLKWRPTSDYTPAKRVGKNEKIPNCLPIC